MIRTALFWTVATLSTVAASLLLLVAVPMGLGHGLQRWWARALLWGAGVRLRIRGRDHAIPRPCVLVSNHASMLDIPACLVALPTRFNFVSRPFFFKVPFLGWGMRLVGHVSLDPKLPRAAAQVLRGLHRHFARGRSLLLFPEGARSYDGTLGRYRRGPFLAAIESGVPVVPLRFDGLHRALPRDSFRVHAQVVPVVIGEPIETRDLGPGDARKLAERVQRWTEEERREERGG